MSFLREDSLKYISVVAVILFYFLKADGIKLIWATTSDRNETTALLLANVKQMRELVSIIIGVNFADGFTIDVLQDFASWVFYWVEFLGSSMAFQRVGLATVLYSILISDICVTYVQHAWLDQARQVAMQLFV